jgi:YfiH family protein
MERLLFPNVFRDQVTAFFTSKDPGADLDEISAMLKLRKKEIFMPEQKHTDTVHILDSKRAPVIADAVITAEQGVLLGIQVADCVPALLYDEKRKIIAAVHAGWKGTALALLQKTVRTMTERYQCRPENIVIAMGPSIKWCCYEVDIDVLTAVKKATGKGDYYKEKGDKFCLDLASANMFQALSAGISPAHTWISDACTYCYPDRFYSYRYAKGPTGRQGGFIGKIK